MGYKNPLPSRAQLNVIYAIAQIEKSGVRATYPEISRVSDLAPSTVHKHVSHLKDLGFISKNYNGHIQLVTRKLVQKEGCPLCGHVNYEPDGGKA